MSIRNLIIYKFASLYHILNELGLDLNFKITFIDNENSLNDKIKNLSNFLILTKKNDLDFKNQIIINNLPINISRLVERINIEFVKLQFNNQSQVKINQYTIDLNSREMRSNRASLKLTEKEVNTIIYLSKKNKPVNINELQENVWSYQTGIETHTVETHIYRLRKKISQTFNNDEFILSKKDGYQIK